MYSLYGFVSWRELLVERILSNGRQQNEIAWPTVNVLSFAIPWKVCVQNARGWYDCQTVHSNGANKQNTIQPTTPPTFNKHKINYMMYLIRAARAHIELRQSDDDEMTLVEYCWWCTVCRCLVPFPCRFWNNKELHNMLDDVLCYTLSSMLKMFSPIAMLEWQFENAYSSFENKTHWTGATRYLSSPSSSVCGPTSQPALPLRRNMCLFCLLYCMHWILCMLCKLCTYRNNECLLIVRHGSLCTKMQMHRRNDEGQRGTIAMGQATCKNRRITFCVFCIRCTVQQSSF